MVLKIMIIGLIIVGIYYAVVLLKDVNKVKKEGKLEKKGRWWEFGIIAVVVNFLDSLGIGNYATTTAAFKFGKLVDDRIIPGTLNTCSSIIMIVEAIVYMGIIQVQTLTLVPMIVAGTIGAYLSAGIVSKLPKRKIEVAMGAALIVVAFITLAGLLGFMPAGGDATGLTGWRLAVAVAIEFFLGALMTIGIGSYAPCLAVVSMLGMSPKVAFPIMMGACAYLMPVCSVKFVKEGSYNRKASFWMNIFGVIGVLIAAYLVKEMNIRTPKWIIICVMIYTSLTMFKSAKETKLAESKQTVTS